MFSFTPLSGAQSESFASQSLLELDGGVKVLIDVGWDESFDVEKLKNLEKHVPTLSLILLTHATVAHLAAFAHCCRHFPLFTRIPIYATTPVISLGRTLLQDLYASTPHAATIIPSEQTSDSAIAYPNSGIEENKSHILLEKPTHDEIASYFSLIHPLKYSQPHQPLPSPFSPPLNGLTITAYNAGHTVGGTIWHIQHGLESIVYAVDWNQARENILAGAAWLGGAGAGGAEVIEQLRKPTALICSSKGAERVALAGGRTKRDELLLDMIKSTIAKGGTILIPTDSSARVLELAYLLEHAWRDEAEQEEDVLYAAGLYLCSKNIGATMRYARSMLEWMDESIIREFEAVAGVLEDKERENRRLKRRGSNTGDSGADIPAGPFDFKYLRMVEKKSALMKLLNENMFVANKPRGKVIIASDSSMEWGFSKDVLKAIAADEKNLIILTEKTKMAPEYSRGGIAATLTSWFEEKKDGITMASHGNNTNMEMVTVADRELPYWDANQQPLEGEELANYQQWQATQRQVQSTLNPELPSLDGPGEAADDESSDSDSESEESETEDKQGRALNISTALGQAGRKKVGLSDEDLGINVLLRRKGVHDYDVRGKKGREKMFPLVIRRKRADDFGELIKPEDYLRAEERDEVDGQDMRQGGRYDSKDTLGKKRKWNDATSSRDRRLSDSGNKRQMTDRNNSVDIPDELLNDTGFVHDVLGGPIEREELEEVVVPSKIIFEKQSLTIKLRISFIDFAGLHDKRSLQMLMPLIQPRKLILVSGLQDETLSLAADCRRILGGGDRMVDVYTPKIGDVVDASVDTNAWAVKLTHDLVKQLRWQKLKGLSITTISGQLRPAPTTAMDEKEEGTPRKKQKTITAGTAEGSETATEESSTTLDTTSKAPTQPAKQQQEPILDVVPLALASATRSAAQPLHVGDLRLPDLRKMMLAAGYTAEFRGEGTLVIDSCVAVRKLGTGRIGVESVGVVVKGGQPIGNRRTFFEVKKRIYEGLAVVAGA